MSEKGAGSVAGCYDVMAGGRAAGVAERVIRIRPEVGETTSHRPMLAHAAAAHAERDSRTTCSWTEIPVL